MRATLRNIFTSIIFFSAILISAQQAKAQYCVDNLYGLGCLYGDYIDNISVGAITQTSTGCGQNGYSDYTNLSTDFEQGSTNTITLTTGNYGEYVMMWIDLNDDYNFDASEKLLGYMFCNTPNTNYSANFYVPPFATLGEHRMRVRCVQYTFPFDACSNYYYGEVHDYTANITPPTDMSYVSSTTNQTYTDAVSLGSTDAQIIGIQVSTSGSLSPIDATSFTINPNGSTNPDGDITGVKIYYTGTSSNFSTDQLFGSATNFSNPITGTQQLSPGVNYFWVAYDISSSGTIGNYVDAECTSVTVGGTEHTPTITAPAGNRQIGYCTPNSLFSCYQGYTDGVELNTLSNTFSYCNGNSNGYIVYDPNGGLTTSLEQGSNYQITLTGDAFNYTGFGVWIDFNNDGDFEDADEFVYSSPFTAIGPQVGSISVPLSATLGDHRMRVRSTTGIVSSSQACTQFSYGEAEDYTITIIPASSMNFVSATTTQTNTAFVTTGSIDQEIIGIQIETQGGLDPFSLTSLTINSNGSTFFSNDVSNVKVYYTGSNNTFATTNLFGSSTDLVNPITGNQTLASGTNYFWVAYDVKTTATIGDQLDAECTNLVMTGNGGSQTPDVTAPSGTRQIDYCTATTEYGCYWGFIDGVQFNTLNNTFSGCNGSVDGYIQYDASQFTTTVEAGTTVPIILTGGPVNDYVGFRVWIDFNNDGDFEDAGESCWGSPVEAPGDQFGSINIPSTATTGDHRMRIRSKEYNTVFDDESCGLFQFTNGETEDYTISITPPSDMIFVSSTTTQTVTEPVSAGATDQQIIGIQIATQGSLNPFEVTSIKVNNNGTTDPNDITNVKIYYTGSSSIFDNTTLFGSATDLTNPISGNQTLEGGNNYFWVTYDISPTATLGNFVDAECEQITMSGSGGTQVPDITAPAGNREINYCLPTFEFGCYFAYIDGVTLNTLSNTLSYCNGNLNGYIQYPQSDNYTTEVELGQNYTLQLDGPFYEAVGFGVWIDYNSDGDFSDQGEFVFASPYYTYGSQFATLTLPCNSDYVGDHRMRVRAFDYYAPNAGDACTQFDYGETEDYTITLSPATTDQVYSSSTTTQNNQDAVGTGVPDAEILGIQVVMAGCNNPMSAISFSLNSTGSTNFDNDVSNVKIYYTGTSPVFATTNLFGSATNLDNPISGSQELNAGTNYFWVAYDVSSTATLGDYLDAGCDQIALSSQGTVTPSTTAPFGNRQINYCVPATQYGCYWGYIDDVEINTLSHSFSGCNGNFNGYVLYDQSSYTTTLQMGNTYTATLTGGPSYDYVGFAVWIDFNSNNNFDDPGEFVWASPIAAPGTQTFTFTVPNDPSFAGDRRLRIRSKEYNTITADQSCEFFQYYYGETEDYTITIEAPPACTGTPTAGTVSADPVIICDAGNSTSLAVSGYSLAADLSFQWQSSTDGVNYNDVSGATNTTYFPSISASTYYRAEVTCDNSGESSLTDGIYIKLGGDEQITSTTGVTICGEGNVTVSASGTGDYVLWYQSETDPSPVYYSSSPSDYTSFVNTTTTYYAASASGSVNMGHVGPVDNTIWSTDPYITYAYENFDVMKPCTIVGVYVYPASAGNVQLYLTDNNNINLETATVAVTEDQVNQKTYIPLAWNFTAAGSYHLAWGYSSVNLICNDYNPNGYPYPYTLDNVISITGSAYGPFYYMYAYDWIIDYSQLCVSPKLPVTITTTPSQEFTVTSDPSTATICAGSGESVTLSASGGGYNSFTWSPADGLSGNLFKRRIVGKRIQGANDLKQKRKIGRSSVFV